MRTAALALAIIAGAPLTTAPASGETTQAATERLISPSDGPLNIVMAKLDPRVTVVTMQSGVYRLTAPIVLSPRKYPLTLRSQVAGRAILDGAGRIPEAIQMRGANFTISGLTIRNFARSGIVMTGVDSVRIDDNRFSGINSTGWNQAAILGVHRTTHIQIRGNTIADTGYAGIAFVAPPGGRLADIEIADNRISDTCRAVADCGAVLVTGRPGTSGLVIARNVIRDYGSQRTQARAIYLDDGLSGALVTGNDVSGTGQHIVHIHGGSNNRIVDNRFDARGAAEVLFEQSSKWAAGRMRDNVFADNRLKMRPGQKLKRQAGANLQNLDMGRNAVDLN